MSAPIVLPNRWRRKLCWVPMVWPVQYGFWMNRFKEQMMTRTTLIVLSMAAAALAQPGPPPGRGGPGGPGGFGGARLLGAEPGMMRGRVVKNSPFTGDIVTETNQTLQDGN